MSKVVSISIEEAGRWYEVVVQEDNETLYEYRAGNNVLDSQGYVEPGSRFALSFGRMREHALSTAREIAEEHEAVLDEVIEVYENDGTW